jgi:hypothetical protein
LKISSQVNTVEDNFGGILNFKYLEGHLVGLSRSFGDSTKRLSHRTVTTPERISDCCHIMLDCYCTDILECNDRYVFVSMVRRREYLYEFHFFATVHMELGTRTDFADSSGVRRNIEFK